MSKPLIKYVKRILTSFVGVLGISSLIAIPAFSQSNPANPSSRVNTSRIGTTRKETLIRGTDTYPYGSRINRDGTISVPTGERTIPSVSVKRGDGSTSYYYPDGSRITVERSTIHPTGTLIR